MNKHTYKERLMAGLLALGHLKCDDQPSKKYVAFQKPGSLNKTFVGPNGALRHGVSATNSISVGCPTGPDAYFKKVLDAGDTAIASLRAS